ncbi:MAG: hypothetical protein IFK94_11490 [Acidobacteria bacterium]|uniref:Rhamnogalacturonan lyase domain-containing protein n=1 Tax=Candidatus Polarisedimenticola svalbardensis TaxID=2886004 RepID=A0A8J6Y1L9_9BACT|nr:hypothetical protein [Candidatus Polarisedimenticola svalbardensis]
MRKSATFTLILVLAVPVALAGNIQGKVISSGLRHNADAVVYVDEIPGKTFPPPAEAVVMDQVDMSFVPHVLPVIAGTKVEFLNSDSFMHNVFTPDKCAGKFNLGSWPQGQKRDFTFEKTCVAVLLCNVHPEMEAFVVALPTPYFAVTDRDGGFTIADVPDGDYTIRVWHPKLPEWSQSLSVSGPTSLEVTLKAK